MAQIDPGPFRMNFGKEGERKVQKFFFVYDIIMIIGVRQFVGKFGSFFGQRVRKK